jgi:hypothetical protein
MEIEGYENYLIYEDGRVYSKKTKIYLSTCDDGNGYLQVGLSKDGNQKSHKIHRLVAEHYIPNPDNKPCVDHIYRDKTDNRVENLRWATISENGQNRGVQKNNKVGIKNICYDKINDTYKYEKKINNKIHKKTFKTLEEAIAYKEDYER